jgi:hypothetical protein
VKYKGDDERDIPDLRLMAIKPNQTIEVTAEQMEGLVCQDIWEKTTATKSAPVADPEAAPAGPTADKKER